MRNVTILPHDSLVSVITTHKELQRITTLRNLRVLGGLASLRYNPLERDIK